MLQADNAFPDGGRPCSPPSPSTTTHTAQDGGCHAAGAELRSMFAAFMPSFLLLVGSHEDGLVRQCNSMGRVLEVVTLPPPF